MYIYHNNNNNMPCSICEYYYLKNKKSSCGCSYGNDQVKQNKNVDNLHYCAVCKIKVSGSLLDCTKQPVCNGCYSCKTIFGICIACN